MNELILGLCLTANIGSNLGVTWEQRFSWVVSLSLSYNCYTLDFAAFTA